jgi:hypothetical protein
MQVTSTTMPKKASRFKIGRIATAIGFALVIGSFGVGPARAADDHRGGGGGNRGAVAHRDSGYHGARRGSVNYAATDNYYAPAPNYYYAPEPEQYYGPEQDYSAPPPEGISLFFGL